ALFQVWTWSDWSTTKWGSWSGCVEDRDYIAGVVENDVLDTAPDMTTSTSTSAMRTRYPARPCDEDVLRRVTPLTTNWTTLHSEVTAMEPAGKTNIAIGMVWGWHLLSPTAL